MKVSSVTKYKALIEMSVDELYRISEALDAVINQHSVLDKSIVPYAKEAYQEVHEELIDMVINITDRTGSLIPS